MPAYTPEQKADFMAQYEKDLKIRQDNIDNVHIRLAGEIASIRYKHLRRERLNRIRNPELKEQVRREVIRIFHEKKFNEGAL